MTETQEQIERRLAEIDGRRLDGSRLVPRGNDLAWLIETCGKLLPALAVARAAVAMKDASEALMGSHSTPDEFKRLQNAYFAELATYDAALARFADAEGGRR
jgi:hypothetical protein